MIGSAIGGRVSFNTSDDHDAMDGELVCRWVWYLPFLLMFRQVSASELGVGISIITLSCCFKYCSRCLCYASFPIGMIISVDFFYCVLEAVFQPLLSGNSSVKTFRMLIFPNCFWLHSVMSCKIGSQFMHEIYYRTAFCFYFSYGNYRTDLDRAFDSFFSYFQSAAADEFDRLVLATGRLWKKGTGDNIFFWAV